MQGGWDGLKCFFQAVCSRNAGCTSKGVKHATIIVCQQAPFLLETPRRPCPMQLPPSGQSSHRFVQARRLAKDDPDGMAAMCQQLLANEKLETAMRAGDVFAALVDHFFGRGDWQQCYSLMARYAFTCVRESAAVFLVGSSFTGIAFSALFFQREHKAAKLGFYLLMQRSWTFQEHNNVVTGITGGKIKKE